MIHLPSGQASGDGRAEDHIAGLVTRAMMATRRARRHVKRETQTLCRKQKRKKTVWIVLGGKSRSRGSVSHV